MDDKNEAAEINALSGQAGGVSQSVDAWQAQYNFWSSFGVPAYERNSVPDLDTVAFPYITYQAVSGGSGSDIPVTASVWSRSLSWVSADELAESIHAALGGIHGGGLTVSYDGGGIWITPEDNFAESMGDPDDDRIKRKVISVVLHFL